MQQKKRVFYFDPEDPVVQAMKNELSRAFAWGYSVVELQRLLGHSTSKKIYLMLREQGAIEPLPRKRQHQYKLPDLLAGGLRKCGLGFLQWCNSHRMQLDPDPTAEALQTSEDTDNLDSVLAHRAVRRDFPHIYKRIYLDAQYIPPARAKKPVKRSRDTVTIRFNDESNTYEAFVHEKPDCFAEGESHEDAFQRLKFRVAAYNSLIKLQLLPYRDEEMLQEEVFVDIDDIEDDLCHLVN